MRLRNHFVVLVAATLLPVLVLAVTVVLLVQRERHASMQRGLQGTARALAAAVDRELDSSVTALETLGDSPALDEGNLPAFYEHARRARDDNPRWLTVFLVEASGRQVMTLLRPLGAPLPDAGDVDYVRAVLDTRRPYVSDLALGVISQRYIITINVPVLRGGRLRYVLGASLVTDALADLLARQAGPAGSVAAIRDRRGALVARSRDQERHVGRQPNVEFAEALQRARATGENVFEVDSLEGERVYAAAGRVPTADFMVVVATPTAAVGALRFWWLLWVGGGVIFVSALGVSILLARRVARPIAELSKAAAQLAAGEPIPAAATSSVPEIAAVRAAILGAADALREQAAERERRLAAERTSREKDEFLAMLAHELRNPLGAIASAVSVLERIGGGEKLTVRAREIVGRQVAHLVGIVEDLLDVSRVSVGKILLSRRPLDLGELVRRAVDGLDAESRTARHDVTLTAAPVWVDGDETRLEQVIGNLLANALKYTPAGGHVHVSVDAEGGEAVVRVRDDGIGIAADRLGSIFDLFFQGERGLDRAQGGLGIGLTLVKRLVELHGGSVAAASAGPDHGSTFTVRLPRIPMVPSRLPAEPTAPPRRRRVLLIEDNADAREMLRTALELSGHTVDEADDGAAGLARAEAARPDAAIVDIGLPGIDGYEVARRLRALAGGGDIVLIALTGYGQPEDRRRSEEAGFDTHLVKPVDPAALERTLSADRRR